LIRIRFGLRLEAGRLSTGPHRPSRYAYDSAAGIGELEPQVGIRAQFNAVLKSRPLEAGVLKDRRHDRPLFGLKAERRSQDKKRRQHTNPFHGFFPRYKYSNCSRDRISL
jgi:hypothetical protein